MKKPLIKEEYDSTAKVERKLIGIAQPTTETTYYKKRVVKTASL